MKKKNGPKTEKEYWEVIDALGGFAWKMNHDLSDGRIEDPEGMIDKDIANIRKQIEEFVLEIKEKFGVIPPNECPKVEIGEERPKPPEGKIYYWDWYKKMKNLSYGIEYEEMICSACPFSDGLEKMISLGGVVPCGVFPGMAYRLGFPYMCSMVKVNEWTNDQLCENILKKGGEIALTRFKIKCIGLKTAYDLKKGKLIL